MWAGSAGSTQAIDILLRAGANVNSHDFEGLTTLHCSASRGHAMSLKAILMEKDIEIDATDTNGCSALFYAVTLGHVECTEALIQSGALINRQDMKGRTPAHCAAAKGILKSLKTLKNFGADLWIKNKRGDYPLHESVHSGEKEVISWLLNQKPESVNSTNNEGRTLLHLAALYDKIEICKVLMDQGAFVNPIMRNSKGQLLTPFDAAMHRSNKGCAKYLQLHGGVPAIKITDKNALQKALVRAFSESQGEQVLPVEYKQVNETKVEQNMLTEPSSDQAETTEASNQTEENPTEEKVDEAGLETINSDNKMESKEIQTSPEKIESVKSFLESEVQTSPEKIDLTKTFLEAEIQTSPEKLNSPEHEKTKIPDSDIYKVEIDNDQNSVDNEIILNLDTVTTIEEVSENTEKQSNDHIEKIEEENTAEEISQENTGIPQEKINELENIKNGDECDNISKLDETDQIIEDAEKCNLKESIGSDQSVKDNETNEIIEYEKSGKDDKDEIKETIKSDESVKDVRDKTKETIEADKRLKVVRNKTKEIKKSVENVEADKDETKVSNETDTEPTSKVSSANSSKRSFENVVKQRFEKEWSVDEMRRSPKKKRVPPPEDILEENLIKFQQSADNIAQQICEKLKEELKNMELRSETKMSAELEEQRVQVKEILNNIENLNKSFIAHVDEKKDELEKVMQRADSVLCKVKSGLENIPQLADEKAKRTIETARKAREEFYESQDKTTTVSQFTYTDEYDRNEDNDDTEADSEDSKEDELDESETVNKNDSSESSDNLEPGPWQLRYIFKSRFFTR